MALEGPFCTQTKITWLAKIPRWRSRTEPSIPSVFCGCRPWFARFRRFPDFCTPSYGEAYGCQLWTRGLERDAPDCGLITSFRLAVLAQIFLLTYHRSNDKQNWELLNEKSAAGIEALVDELRSSSISEFYFSIHRYKLSLKEGFQGCLSLLAR